tara:strand:- start:6835 stop:7068 length:234 start_codon:yes stop_codon:yes gene_type:complete
MSFLPDKPSEKLFDTPEECLFDGELEKIDGEYNHRSRKADHLTQNDYGDIAEIRRIKEMNALRKDLPEIRWKKIIKI